MGLVLIEVLCASSPWWGLSITCPSPKLCALIVVCLIVVICSFSPFALLIVIDVSFIIALIFGTNGVPAVATANSCGVISVCD